MPPTTKAVALILNAIVETVHECGADGAPGGVLYAALMSQGPTARRGRIEERRK